MNSELPEPSSSYCSKSSQDVLLQINHLNLAYPQPAQATKNSEFIQWAVQDVSFTLQRGERLGLVGESGCGKSTLGRGIMRLLPPGSVTQGQIDFDGQSVLTLSPERLRQFRGDSIALIFQDPMTRLDPLMTIGDHCLETLQAHRPEMSRPAAKQLAIATLKAVSIPASRWTQYPHEFSGGMRQRVAIALALLLNPKMIVADEPTTSLDVTISAQILQELTRLCDERDMALILISHDLALVGHYCDRIAVMYQGNMVELGDAHTVLTRPEHEYTRSLLNAALELQQSAKDKGVGEDRRQKAEGLEKEEGIVLRSQGSNQLPSGSRKHSQGAWDLEALSSQGSNQPPLGSPKYSQESWDLHPQPPLGSPKYSQELWDLTPHRSQGSNQPPLGLPKHAQEPWDLNPKSEIQNPKSKPPLDTAWLEEDPWESEMGEYPVEPVLDWVSQAASSVDTSTAPVTTAPVLLRVSHLKQYYVLEQNILAKLFSGAKTQIIKAVDDVSFELQAGEILGLVGESGCGKSTLSRTILQLVKPTAGNVEFLGQDLTGLSRAAMQQQRRQIQMIFQDPHACLNPMMTVGEGIADPLRIHKLATPGKAKLQVQAMMERVGLTPVEAYYSRYPGELSGGQQQRVAIARALITRPKLLICDEPVSMLDASVQAQVLNLMIELKDEFDLTYLFITHDLWVARFLCDRIAVMNSGQIVEMGPTAELFTNAQHRYTKMLLGAASSLPVADA